MPFCRWQTEMQSALLPKSFVWAAYNVKNKGGKVTLVNKTNVVHNFSCMFISILYMFRANMCPSSGEVTVSVWHLVCHSAWMTVWYASQPAYQTVNHTVWQTLDVTLIQLLLLMMGTRLPETCSREDKNAHHSSLIRNNVVPCIRLSYDICTVRCDVQRWNT